MSFIRNTLSTAIGGLLITLAPAMRAQNAPNPLPTPVSVTRTYSFVPVGLAGSETMQVNLLNTATVSSTSTATASCTGTVTFANANGATIGTATKFTAGSGKIVSVPLPFSGSGLSSRGEIQVSVQQTVDVPSTNLCSLSMSLEVFDTSTGVVHAVLLSTASAGIEPVLAVVAPDAASR